MNNTGNTTDTLIYQALFLVDLQGQYFESVTTPKQEGIDDFRLIFKEAVKYTLTTYRGYWALKQISLSQESGLEANWYRAPFDLIAWIAPMPTNTGYDSLKRPIYYLPASDIVYVYDREDLSTLPSQVIEYIKIYFLFCLTPKNMFSPAKIARVDQMLAVVGKELAKYTQEYSIKTRGSHYIWRLI